LYYNNNQRFLQKRLDPNVIKTSKIFEKAEIRWVCIDDIKKMRPEFRSYFQTIVDIMLNQKESIQTFIERSLKKSTKKKTLRKGGRRRKTRKN
jgi:transcription termination factor NusB